MEPIISPRAAMLAALERGPGFGLELIDRTAQLTGDAVKLSQGTVYPLLRALEREGLLASYEVPGPPSRGGRPRIYYKLTPSGGREAKALRTAISALFDDPLPAGHARRKVTG